MYDERSAKQVKTAIVADLRYSAIGKGKSSAYVP